MLIRNSRARWVAACVLACLSLAPRALVGAAALAAAQNGEYKFCYCTCACTETWHYCSATWHADGFCQIIGYCEHLLTHGVRALLLACQRREEISVPSILKIPGALVDSSSPSQTPSIIRAQRQQGLYKSDGFMSPSYWPIGLWNTPDPIDPSPAPSISPSAPASASLLQGAGAPTPQYDGSTAASRKLQAPDSAPPTSSFRPARLESQSVPATPYSFMSASPAGPSSSPARSPSQNSYTGSSLVTGTNADTAPAVAGPAGVPPPPSAKVTTTPSPAGSNASTVTISPGIPSIAPAPAPASPPRQSAFQQSGSSIARPPSSSRLAAGPTPGQQNATIAAGPSPSQQNATAAAAASPAQQNGTDSASPTVSAYSVTDTPRSNPFEPGPRVISSPISTPSSTPSAGIFEWHLILRAYLVQALSHIPLPTCLCFTMMTTTSNDPTPHDPNPGLLSAI